MADAIIKHFKDFEIAKLVSFGEQVRLGVGQVVYDKKLEDLDPLMVTVESRRMGPGSCSGSPSGTEVELLLDAEEWPLDHNGLRVPVEESIVTCTHIAKSLGRLLMGGVEKTEGLVVPVWVSQNVSSGYDGY